MNPEFEILVVCYFILPRCGPLRYQKPIKHFRRVCFVPLNSPSSSCRRGHYLCLLNSRLVQIRFGPLKAHFHAACSATAITFPELRVTRNYRNLWRSFQSALYICSLRSMLIGSLFIARYFYHDIFYIPRNENVINNILLRPLSASMAAQKVPFFKHTGADVWHKPSNCFGYNSPGNSTFMEIFSGSSFLAYHGWMDGINGTPHEIYRKPNFIVLQMIIRMCRLEMDCLWRHWLTFWQPEEKSSSESSELM